jgi:4'-phosphopantetheinyl transferase EntD
MFESLFAAVFPVVKDLLWTAAAALLAYALNKIQTQFNTI